MAMESLFRGPEANGNAKGLIPNAIFTTKSTQNSVHAPITFHSRTLHSQVSALIDSGATKNFISPDLIEHFSILTYKIPRPKVVRNIDGTKNNISNVTLTATLKIHYQNKDTEHTFYVIGLGNDHMLLRMPFLRDTNPHINWTNSAFKNKVYAITTDTHKWTPRQDSEVFKPFVKPKIEGYRHYERTNSPIQYLHIKSKDYLSLQHAYIETALLC